MHEQLNQVPSSNLEKTLVRCTNKNCSAVGRPRYMTASGICPMNGCNTPLEKIVNDEDTETAKKQPLERKIKPSLDLSVIKGERQVAVLNLIKSGVINYEEIASKLEPPSSYQLVKTNVRYICKKLEIEGGIVELVGLITPAIKKPEGNIGLKEKLGPEQMKMVGLILQGFGNREIAENLGTTEPIVKSEFRDIYKLLGVKNQTELAHLAASEGL